MACFRLCGWRVLSRTMSRVKGDFERAGAETLLGTGDGSSNSIGVGDGNRRPQRNGQERAGIAVQSGKKVGQNQTQDGLQCGEGARIIERGALRVVAGRTQALEVVGGSVEEDDVVNNGTWKPGFQLVDRHRRCVTIRPHCHHDEDFPPRFKVVEEDGLLVIVASDKIVENSALGIQFWIMVVQRGLDRNIQKTYFRRPRADFRDIPQVLRGGAPVAWHHKHPNSSGTHKQVHGESNWLADCM